MASCRSRSRWARRAARSAWRSGRIDTPGYWSSHDGQKPSGSGSGWLGWGLDMTGPPVRLAGGPLWAGSAWWQDPLRSGWCLLLVVAVDRVRASCWSPLLLPVAVGGGLADPDPLGRLPSLLPGGPLGWLARHRAQRLVGVGELVGAAVVLDGGRGLPPGPPAPGRLWDGSEFVAQVAGLVVLGGQAAGSALPGQLPDDLLVGGAEVGIRLQPAGPALLMPTQLEFGVSGAVCLLAGHRHHPTGSAGPLFSPQQANHPPALVRLGRLSDGELLEEVIGLGSAGGGPLQLPGPIPRGLVEQALEPVPLGPQLGGGQPPQIQGARGVDRQPLVASAGERLGELAVAVADLPVGQVQLGRRMGFGSDDRVQPGILLGPGQLHIQPVAVLGAGQADQRP